MSEPGGVTGGVLWADANEQAALQRYRTLVGTIDDGIFQLDADGRFVTVNDVVVERLGFAREELVGEHVSLILDDAEADRVEGVVDHVVEADEDGVAAVELPVRTADGETRFCELRVSPLEENGEVRGTVGIVRDVTDRQERGERRRRERRLLDRVFEASPIGISAIDPDGEVVTFNERAAEMVGADPEEVGGSDYDGSTWELYDADDEPIPVEERAFARVVETGEPVTDFEAQVERPDGDRVWLSFNGVPVFDTDGELSLVVLTYEDVTELKERERQLQRRKDELETELGEILGRISDAFYAVDDQWRFTHVNEQAEKLLGATSEELLGEVIWDAFPEAADSVLEERYREAMETQEPVTFERYSEPLGILADVRAYPSETGLSVYFEDVTQRRERERKLERYERIVENLPVGVYRNTPGPEGEFVEGNSTLASIFDADSPEEIMEYNVSDLYPDPDRRAEFSRRLEEEGMVEGFELKQETLDGETIWISVTAIRTEEDGEVYFDGIVQDVTERKERERRLSTLMENVPGMVYRSRNDRGWPMEFVSEGCRELTGYEPEALERGELSFGEDVVHEADREELWEEVQQGLDDGGSFLVTYRIVTPEGDVRWVRERGRGVYDEDGALEALEGVIIDVTERKRLEAELEEIYGRVSDAFYAIDEEYRFTHVNERAEELIDDADEDLVGKQIWDAFEWGAHSKLREESERAMATQEATAFELHAPDPIDRWYDVSVYPSETGLSVYFQDITERKRAQQQLQEERDMFAEGPAVVFRWTPDAEEGWPVEYVSENVEDVFGYTPEELESGAIPYTDLLLEEEIDRIAGEVEENSDGTTERFSHEPYRIRTKDGDVRWVKDITKIIRDDTGTITNYLGYLVDITDRKEHEQELTQYETIVETVNDGIYVVDEDGRFTMVNEAYAEIVGYSRDELLGEHVSLVVDEEVIRRAREAEESMRDGEVDHAVIEAELVTASGERVPSEATFAMFEGPGGTEHRIGVARDVTERKERERELEQYETVARTASDVIVTIDTDSVIRDVNPAVADVFGYEPAELEGESLLTLMPDRLSGDHVEAVDQYLREGERNLDWNYVELPGVRADGTEIPLAISFSEYEHGGDRYFTGIVRDISERRERERELEQSRRRYRTVVENFPNGAVGLVDENLRYRTAGGSPVDVEADTGEDLEGTPIRDAISPELADVLEPRYRAALEGESSTFEHEHHGNYSRFHIFPVRDDDGDVFAAMGMSQDITEQKEREQYLEDAKSQLEAATEAGAVGTWEWNVQEDRMVTDASFARTFGVDPDAAREGVSLEQFVSSIHEDDRDRVEAKIDEALESCGEYEAEYRVRNADGELRWLVARGRVECDEDGTPVTFPGALTDITERKRAELELQRNKEQLETLFEVLPVGVVVADRDGRLVDANDTAKEIWGGEVFDAESTAEYDKFSAVWADSGDPVERDEWTMSRVLQGEEVIDPDVFEIEAADGERRIIRAEGMPVRDEGGAVRRGVVTMSDITERREYQRQLEESERRYRTLVENFPNGAVGLFDENLEYTVVGGEMLEELGSSSEEIVGQSLWERYPDDLARQLEPNFRAALEGQSNSFGIEYHDRDWLAYTLPVEDSDGDIFAGMMMVQDITDQKQMEAELRESEHRYRALAENFPDGGVGVFDEDLRYTLVTGTMWDDIEPDAADLEGETIRDALPPDTADDVEPIFRDALEGETGSVVSHLGGRTYRVWATPLRDADGEITAGQSFALDITDQLERERRLEELVEKLEESNERLEQFAYAASHDLQEPLRMVSSYLSLIERRYGDELDAEAEEFFEFAVDGAERMREMIDALLEYSRVETRGDPFDVVDLDDVFEDARQDLAVKIEESDAEITKEPLPRVEGDSNQLRQVFQNILDNAIEYSGDEPPRVHVSAERDGSAWRIGVRDEGIGIDLEHTDRVFEVFQRLHTHDEHTGTGIGLALCQRIVERHGGRIWVDSEPGEGSTFYFTLPVEENIHDRP